jgi:hypothetical protein
MNNGPGAVDWLYQFTQSLTDLTLQNGGALSNFGMILLTFIATMILIGIAVRMSSWSSHFGGYRTVSMDELKVFLFRLLFCLVLEHYWVNNLPGANFGFNRMFSYMAGAIAQILDQNSLNQLTGLLHTAGQNTPMPSVFAPMEIACYCFVEGFLGIASGVLFLLNCSSFIFYAVAALFGPLLIPLYLTETFRGKFVHFVEVLASFAMIRAVAAAFIFVWSQVLIGFINQTFQGDYSIANWLANLIPFLTIFVAFILNMVLVPTITQIIFGGGSASAGKIAELAERLAAFGAVGGI